MTLVAFPIVFGVLGLLLDCKKGLASTDKNAVPSALAQPTTASFDDKAELFVPLHPRTDDDRDRLEAMALFTTGRMHEHREEYVDALRCYQRALRLDPKAAAVVRSLIAVAIRLKRYSEAIRYTAKIVELEDIDPLMLRRLGVYLAEEGDWEQAVSLYEKALHARGKKKELASDILLRMEMGRLYHLMEKPEQAAECFARVSYAMEHPAEFSLDESLSKVLLGDPAPTYRMMGECYLAAGRLKEAADAFENAEKASPNEARHQYDLARIYAKTDKPAEALAAMEAAFAVHLSNEGIAPYALYADLLKRLNRAAETIAKLESLRNCEPGNYELIFFLANSYEETGEYAKAESLYRELLKKEPSIAVYRSLVEIYRKTNRPDALLDLLGEALEKTNVLDLLGAESQAIAKDAPMFDQLIATAKKRLDTQPDSLTYGMRLALGVLALEAKRYDTAGEFLRQALVVSRSADKESPESDEKSSDDATPPSEEEPTAPVLTEGNLTTNIVSEMRVAKPSKTAEVFMVWGVGLLLGEQADEAAKVFQQAIQEKALPDDNPAFYFYLAGALVIAGKTDDALAAARVAAERRPDSARYSGREAWVLYYAKRYDAAAKAYGRLVAAFDADHAAAETRTVLREARLVLSNLCVQKGEVEQAQEWLEQVLDEFPDDEGAMNDLGYLWADQNKNLERARRMVERAVQIDPDNLAYRDSLGWVLYRQGQIVEAVAELEKAASGPKLDGVVLDHLGDAYLKAGQREKAVESWRKAIKVFQQEQETEKAAALEKKIRENY